MPGVPSLWRYMHSGTSRERSTAKRWRERGQKQEAEQNNNVVNNMHMRAGENTEEAMSHIYGGGNMCVYIYICVCLSRSDSEESQDERWGGLKLKRNADGNRESVSGSRGGNLR